ncbi:hypothetical protein M0D21_13015 [Aquimarina sp. D1M17]|uniref:hypothetical protein n=1 Tax=Aquimarina acroporae TaxID=2937283 RepID=UPI0020BFEF9B|nr:hypothetical protein [Aquimarina acroporae]MCK8522498.1 hypothetical protein [Aquimarina acroporae]
MLASLKNNNRRSKREAFEGWTTSNKESQGIEIEPIAEEVLVEIRNKLKAQRKKEKIRNIIILILSVIATFLFFLFLFYYFYNSTGISDEFLYR